MTPDLFQLCMAIQASLDRAQYTVSFRLRYSSFDGSRRRNSLLLKDFFDPLGFKGLQAISCVAFLKKLREVKQL